MPKDHPSRALATLLLSLAFALGGAVGASSGARAAGATPTPAVAIEVRFFELRAPAQADRLREIQDAEDWYANESKRVPHLSDEEFGLALAAIYAEAMKEQGRLPPGVSKKDLEKFLPRALAAKLERELSEVKKNLSRRDALEREHDRRIIDAVRGLDPVQVQRCVVAAGGESVATLHEGERTRTVYYRVHGIEAQEARLEILQNSGFGVWSETEGVGYGYPFGEIQLRENACGVVGKVSGEKYVDCTIGTIELRRTTSPPRRQCVVRDRRVLPVVRPAPPTGSSPTTSYGEQTPAAGRGAP